MQGVGNGGGDGVRVYVGFFRVYRDIINQLALGLASFVCQIPSYPSLGYDSTEIMDDISRNY